MRSAASTNGLGWGSLMTMIWPSGLGGPGLHRRWRMIFSFITLAAGHSSAMALTLTDYSMKTRRGSRPSGGIPFHRGGECG